MSTGSLALGDGWTLALRNGAPALITVGVARNGGGTAPVMVASIAEAVAYVTQMAAFGARVDPSGVSAWLAGLLGGEGGHVRLA